MPDTPQPIQPVPPADAGEIEIHTIPDKFYGAALKAQVVEEKKPTTPIPDVSKKSKAPIIVAVIIVLILGAGGGFAYFNQDLLFPAKPTPEVIVEAPKAPEPLPIPSTPTDVSATSSNPNNVVVSWKDTSTGESGFRIERDNGSGTFAVLTTLPSNSTSFLDSSVQPKTAYLYRIRALGVSGESDPSVEASAVTADVPPPPPDQPKLPPAGLDTDSDGLTDLEEALFGTNARAPDADDDGFLDGNEVFHLYNPGGQAPARLLDLSLIKIVEGRVGWVMGIPASWVSTFNDPDGTKTTFDTKHGETFIITVEDNPQKKPLVEWYLDSHPEANATQILQYRSKGGYTGIIGPSLLVTYLPWGDKVFVFTYDLDGQTFINYRTTYSMMLNSLMLSGAPVTALSSGATLPFEPSATSSGVVAQPVPVQEPVKVESAVETVKPGTTTSSQ